uniref:TPM_phosphatase domain-containing protein n=1 Tax=Anisakis simplex TaxID=6269 RepID=A0A0M3JQE8_ANISI
LCLLHLIAVLVFAGGFFPAKSKSRSQETLQSPGTTARNSDVLRELIRDEKCFDELMKRRSEFGIFGGVMRKDTDKLVIMVIDAWRAGFYFSDKEGDKSDKGVISG